jgi:S-adenosylmethionine:diacylglycerol 3-amino-3-carboxypropyl transferase
MKAEYDFSKGIRGKFYYPNTEFNLPIYLEPEIAEFVQKLATEKDVDRSRIVNILLKKDIETVEI